MKRGKQGASVWVRDTDQDMVDKPHRRYGIIFLMGEKSGVRRVADNDSIVFFFCARLDVSREGYSMP